MKRILLAATLVCALVAGAGCTDAKGDDYGDAPDEIKDGQLDYRDYKEVNCPYLEGALDQRTMKKCNDWIRENNVTVD